MHCATYFALCALCNTLCLVRPAGWAGAEERDRIVPLAVGAKCLLNQAILSSTGFDLGMTDCTTSLLGLKT